MLLGALLLLTGPETAVDAERAFNRAAQTDGQWTAFRAFMAPDAIVFTPQPAKAAEALPAKDPRIAVQWWPAESYVSCDGNTAVNTGSWVRPNSAGYFTTVWSRQPDGRFKWVIDHGDALAEPRALPETPRVKRGRCAGKPKPFLAGTINPDQARSEHGQSADRSLQWQWASFDDGSRMFDAWLWTGREFAHVVHDVVAAPAP